jgi:hypothetical protein
LTATAAAGDRSIDSREIDLQQQQQQQQQQELDWSIATTD